MSNISIYMDENTLKLLNKEAEAEKRSRSNLIRKIFIDYIENKDKE
ncbi:hypothetical protein LCGC14_1031190 [marine sediment metagenome]|uniref:Ribbon-helix-helix protein CopG domain-containing protein n=1 Tax=marine sediment metagenome TaxID=412755 RepID=A0A0F9MUI5_9ZZZZ